MNKTEKATVRQVLVSISFHYFQLFLSSTVTVHMHLISELHEEESCETYLILFELEGTQHAEYFLKLKGHGHFYSVALYGF